MGWRHKKNGKSGDKHGADNVNDSVLWDSHPEISLENYWTPERLKSGLAKIRSYGIEPIPLLNFASTLGAWFGKYSKMVSTTPYYSVCKDLIAVAIDIFDTPWFIHFGMNEENYDLQRVLILTIWLLGRIIFGGGYFYIAEAFKRNVRPWIWSDKVWVDLDQFFKKMPKTVLQSNWFYGRLDSTNNRVKAYVDLGAKGYDQIPIASFMQDLQEIFRKQIKTIFVTLLISAPNTLMIPDYWVLCKFFGCQLQRGLSLLF